MSVVNVCNWCKYLDKKVKCVLGCKLKYEILESKIPFIHPEDQEECKRKQQEQVKVELEANDNG